MYSLKLLLLHCTLKVGLLHQLATTSSSINGLIPERISFTPKPPGLRVCMNWCSFKSWGKGMRCFCLFLNETSHRESRPCTLEEKQTLWHDSHSNKVVHRVQRVNDFSQIQICMRQWTTTTCQHLAVDSWRRWRSVTFVYIAQPGVSGAVSAMIQKTKHSRNQQHKQCQCLIIQRAARFWHPWLSDTAKSLCPALRKCRCAGKMKLKQWNTSASLQQETDVQLCRLIRRINEVVFLLSSQICD